MPILVLKKNTFYFLNLIFLLIITQNPLNSELQTSSKFPCVEMQCEQIVDWDLRE